MPRSEIMNNFYNKDNIGYIFPRQCKGESGFNHGFVAKNIIDEKIHNAATEKYLNYKKQDEFRSKSISQAGSNASNLFRMKQPPVNSGNPPDGLVV